MKAVNLLISFTFLVSLFSCSNTGYKAGDICSVESGDGTFGIVKVLAVEPEVVHVRIYKNKFDSRPASIDSKSLSLGRPGEEGGFGIGHVPLDKSGFNDWKPEILQNIPVTEDELEGYNFWKGSQE